MNTLRTVQVWGVLTKVVTVALGIVQTAIILRLLSPVQYGIVGIVVSLGSLVGVSQHVGVVDATIREIAVATDPRRRAHIFWVSLWFRLLATVPISLALALLGPVVESRIYQEAGLSQYLRLMSVILVLQGIQGVVGGAYTGQRAFGRLYAYQIVMAVLNVGIFGGMTWWHGVRGFFEGVMLSTVLFVTLLTLTLRDAIGGTLVHPRRADVRPIFADLVHTGSWTYVARILSVAWQRVPLLLLGWWASTEVVGLFNAALTFGSKLVILASALGEVNLAFLSNAFARGRQAFQKLAADTLEDVGALTLLGAGFLALFADVLLRVFAGPPYVAAAMITALVTWAYGLFAFLDIGTNTLFVPARRAHYRALAFGALLAVTVGAMIGFQRQPLLAAGVGAIAGGLAGVAVGELLARRRMGFTLLSGRLTTLCIPGAVLAVSAFVPLPLAVRAFCFLFTGGAISWIAFPSVFRRLKRPDLLSHDP